MKYAVGASRPGRSRVVASRHGCNCADDAGAHAGNAGTVHRLSGRWHRPRGRFCYTGSPYDSHAYAETAAILADKGFRVVVPAGSSQHWLEHCQLARSVMPASMLTGDVLECLEHAVLSTRHVANRCTSLDSSTPDKHTASITTQIAAVDRDGSDLVEFSERGEPPHAWAESEPTIWRFLSHAQNTS